MSKACLSACLVYQPKRAISPCMQVRRLAKQDAFAAPYTNERELSPPRKRPIHLVHYSRRRRMYCYYHQRFARLFIHPPLCKIMFRLRYVIFYTKKVSTLIIMSNLGYGHANKIQNCLRKLKPYNIRRLLHNQKSYIDKEFILRYHFSTKPRIRAHLAPFLHALDFGHSCLSKFYRFRIRKNTICNPSAASLLSTKPKTSRFECKPLQVFFCFLMMSAISEIMYRAAVM